MNVSLLGASMNIFVSGWSISALVVSKTRKRGKKQKMDTSLGLLIPVIAFILYVWSDKKQKKVKKSEKSS